MMEFTYQRRPGTELSQLIKYYKGAGQTGRDKRAEGRPALESAEVNISKMARETQVIAGRLARKGDRVLAEKLRLIKKLIVKGEYEFDPRAVAKSIIRTEISRHLEKSKGQWARIDRTEFLALTEEEIATGEKIAAQRNGAKEIRPSVECRRALKTNRCKVKPNLLDFLR